MSVDNINIKTTKIINETEIDKSQPQSIMYDVCGDDDEKITSLPDADTILDDIILLLNCMNTSEMKLLKETNPEMHEQLLEEKFPDFSCNYYSVFKMVLSGDDITPLFKMLEMISNVNTGKNNIEECEKNVGKYLSKFLPDGLIEKLENGQISMNDITQSNNKQNKSKNKNNKKRKYK